VLVAAAIIAGIVAAFLLLTGRPPSRLVLNARIHGPYYPERSRRNMLAVPVMTDSGIENIYIVRWGGYTRNMDLADQPESWYAVITSRKGQTVEIPPGAVFEIVVACRAKAPDNILWVHENSIWVGLKASGAFTIPWGYAPDAREFVFEEEGYGTRSGRLRVNVVWDNYGEGYTLGEDQDLYLENVKLETDLPEK
jgi:hypothetical protein